MRSLRKKRERQKRPRDKLQYPGIFRDRAKETESKQTAMEKTVQNLVLENENKTVSRRGK